MFGVLGNILIQEQRQESFSNSLSCVFVGVDEVTIINILTNRSNEQRQDIAFAYQRRTKKVVKYEEIVIIEYFSCGQLDLPGFVLSLKFKMHLLCPCCHSLGLVEL